MNGTWAIYEGAVEGWISDVLGLDIPGTFDELVCRLPGVYPTEVLAAIDRMAQRGTLDAVTVQRLHRRAGPRKPEPYRLDPLPVPHPLDFDWRFSASTIRRLIEECERRCLASRAVLLGAPSVLWGLQSREDLAALLLDSNPSVTQSFAANPEDQARALLCDLRCDALPKQKAPLVIIDPPWYEEHERLFLWAAAQLCELGGDVLLSAPAEGTRAGAGAQRESALNWAGKLGLKVVGQEPGALRYVSPPFERNALAAAGLGDLPAEWRTGDLITMRLKRRTLVSRPTPSFEDRWPEVALGSVKVRVRPQKFVFPKASIDPQLCQVVRGDVLDSVSRHDPRREKATMWTSGNRIFGSQSAGALLEVVRCIAAGEEPEFRLSLLFGRRLTSLEKRNICTAREQVLAVVATEQAELEAMGWAA